MILGIFWLAPLVYSIVVNTMLAIGVSYLASLMMKKPKQFSPDIGNYPQQTAMRGLPIPKVYGTRRVAGNILWKKDLGEFDIGGGIKVKKASYLIGICEGPATVLRYWLGPTLLSGGGYHHTFFMGDGTGGHKYYGGLIPYPVGSYFYSIRSLTGEEFGDYENNLCCCFVYDQLCNMDGSPPEFTFEVTSGFGDLGYFIGTQPGGNDSKILYKLRPDKTLDTDWADGGGWHYEYPGLGCVSGTSSIHEVYQMPDGRVLVAHNNFWIHACSGVATGKLVGCTMLTAAGEIDTTWGHDGHYVLYDNDTATGGAGLHPVRLLRDNWGNFHLINDCNDGSTGMYHKFDADGNMLQVRFWTANPRWLRNPAWAEWYDDNKQVIIIAGNTGNYPNASYVENMMAIQVFEDADTVLYEAWGGAQLGYKPDAPGYAHVGLGQIFWASTYNAYQFVRVSDGWIVEHSYYTDVSRRTLSKINLMGNIYDTSWGIGGHAVAGWPFAYTPGSIVYDGTSVYTLASVADSGFDEILTVFDSRGQILRQHTFVGGAASTYHYMALNGGVLYLGTTDTTPAYEHIERWKKKLEYIDGFDPVLNSSYMRLIIPIAPQLPNITDANPSHIIKDLVTNTRYGSGLNFDYIDEPSFASVAGYCDDNDILISPVTKDSKPVVDYIDQILAHCNGYRSWSGGKLKLGVFKDEDAIGPPITQDDLVVDGDEEPVTVSPRKRSETFNRIRVGWSNRVNNYDFSSEIAEDQVDQKIGSEVRIREVDLSGICRIELARKIAQRGLFESMYRYNFYTFRVGYKHSLMEVGDVKLLSDGGQIVNQKIRILSIREEKDGRTLAVEAIEEAAGLYLSTTYDSQLAWTPQVIYPTDEVEMTDAAAIAVTPIGSAPAESLTINDYAHLEII